MENRERFSSTWFRRLLFIPPIGVAIAVFAFAVSQRKTLNPSETVEAARRLSITQVTEQTVRPSVVGYGLAQPARSWRAVAQVSGIITSIHPKLDNGTIVQKGERLVQIDTTDYELAIDRATAEIAGVEAQIAELKQSQDNDAAMLKIEQRSLELVQRDLDRYTQSDIRRAVSAAETDAKERDLLQQKSIVQKLQNSLNLVPAKLAAAEAQLQTAKKQLATAKRDLARTTITAPFDCRLANVRVEDGQFVGVNETMFEAYGLDVIEVDARIPLDELRRLSRRLSASDTRSLEDLVFGLDATVRVRSGDWSQHYSAKLVRVREEVDARTRAIGVVVAVERDAVNGGLALRKGMFCEVVFSGAEQPNQLLVPQVAVRDGHVYVVNQESRLERRAVTLGMPIGDKIIVEGNLDVGTSVVLSDPTPAVEGMLIEPMPTDSPTAETLVSTQGAGR